MERITGYPGQQIQISHSFKNPDNTQVQAQVTGVPVFRVTKLRLTIEIPTPDARKYPFGDQRAWQIIYSSDNNLDGYSSSPALANKYFPADGVTSPMPNGWFRIGGELRQGEGLRPVLTDVLVKYIQ